MEWKSRDPPSPPLPYREKPINYIYLCPKAYAIPICFGCWKTEEEEREKKDC
jgi:hypothetical protein